MSPKRFGLAGSEENHPFGLVVVSLGAILKPRCESE